MTAVLGVDGCPGGWVGALLAPDGRVSWHLLADASAISDLGGAVDAVGIDIPIGLPEQGSRACDVEARAALGPRRSSVFAAPVRGVLGAASYDEACALSREVSGRAISRQTWALVPRIRDVDTVLRALPRPARERCVEVHPELSFREMAGRDLPSKHGVAGIAARLGALLPDVSDVLRRLEELPPGPRMDDALDALAVAWTVRRWCTGTARVRPADPPRDTTGLPMRIVT